MGRGGKPALSFCCLPLRHGRRSRRCERRRMWSLLLDPAVQGFAFLLAATALGVIVWDLYDDAGVPTPARGYPRRRRPEAQQEAAPPRKRAYVEPSVEIWTDSQGQTRGRVRRGPSRGKSLEELSREECEAQAAYCREHDPPAAVALDAYMRARFRRERRNGPADGRAQALAELGLGEGATESEIHAAYRTLIKLHHPDHGGSHAKAARINQAKDLLVG